MPVIQPQAKADKAMTLDLAALQSANAAAQGPPPTATSAAPAQKTPATAAAAPVAEDPDFAEPQNPWVHAPEPVPPPQSAAPVAPAAQPTRPAPAPPAAQSSQPAPQPQYPWMPMPAPAPAAPAPQPAGPPQNPWAALASQNAGPPSGAPEPQGQNPWAALQSQQAARPSMDAVATPSQAGAAATQSAAAGGQPAVDGAVPSQVAAVSPAASSPVQRQCFTNSEGVKICYMEDQQHHNTTDVHKEGGVNDYHNQASAHEKQGIQGHVPGNNVTDTLNHLGQNPPPNEQKDGNTVFQGQSEADIKHQHDIHKDNSTFTDHESTSGSMDQDYKSAHKGPDGRKDMAEVSQDGQFRDESDTKVDAQGKDHVDVQTWRGSNDHRFLSDKPGTADDGALTWDEDWARKDQKAEFQGPGVYDLHEESDASSTVRAKVDGDQGWTQFEQDMDYFDALFADDAAWKAKMRDSRVAGPAARLLRRGDDSDSDSDDGHDDDKPHDHLLPESVERWYYPRIDRYASEWREAWVREARGLGAQTCHSGDEQGCGLVIVVPEFHQAAAEYLKLAKKEDPLPQPFRDNVPPALEQIVSWYIQQHRPEMVVVQDVGMAREKMDVTPVEFHGKRDVVVEPRGVEGGPRFKFGWSRGWLPGHHHEKEDDGDNDDDDGKKTKRQILHTEAPLADTAAESEKFAIQPRGAPAPEKCVQDETPWHCACRLGTAPSYPCAVIFGYAGPKIGQNERFKPEDAGALVRRGEAWNPFKEFEEYLKQRHENYWADRKKEEEWKLFVEADKKAHPEEWNDSHKMAFARDVDAVPDSVDLVAAPAGMEDRLQSNTTAGIEHGQSRAAFPVDAMSITVLGLILALFVAVVIQVVKRMRMTPEEKRKEREDYNSRLRDAGIEPRARGDQVEQGPKWG